MRKSYILLGIKVNGAADQLSLEWESLIKLIKRFQLSELLNSIT